MKLLLDTHVFIWWDGESPALHADLRAAIADAANDVYVSAVSVWEIAIKRRHGRIAFTRAITAAIEQNRFRPLAIAPEHAEHAGGLPPHHRDPFDRMLVAQAVLEQMVLGTQDPMMRLYGASVLGLPP